VIESVGVQKSRIHVVEPGVEGELPTVAREFARATVAPLAALLVGNVVPGKGIAPFLEALATELGAVPPAFVLVIVGSLEQDPEYAALCRRVVRAHPALQGAVVFASILGPAQVLRAIAQADVFVSASRMESYGMALAEARALGLPLVARRGGNVEAHVEAASGGELFRDDQALAAGLVRLSRDRAELERRRALALSGVRRRAWKDAALDFLRATSSVP
jgi:glycosyltransferase involved in cell wall biosynthesis